VAIGVCSAAKEPKVKTRDGRTQLWDCVVCVASAQAGAKVLLTEDMQDGRTLAGLRLMNPFAAANDDAIEALLAS